MLFYRSREELKSVRTKTSLTNDYYYYYYCRENEILNKPPDNLTDFEVNVFHNLEIIKTSGIEMSPMLWPRDTLFQYFILLEACANNMDERDKIMGLCSMGKYLQLVFNT
jgi:hypothetical protein